MRDYSECYKNSQNRRSVTGISSTNFQRQEILVRYTGSSSETQYEGYICQCFETLRGILPVYDHPGLLPNIRESNNKRKSSFSGS